MNIIILGPQGSGKGTQAKFLVDKFKLFYLDMGKFLRGVAKGNSNIDKIMNQKGKLLPAGIVFSLMSEHLENKVPGRKNILFDGYPRSIKQHEMLRDWLGEKGTEINHVVLLEISENESIKRLSARRICEKCGTIYNLITNPPPEEGCGCGGKLTQRLDDKPEAIKQRLSEYKKTTKPLVEIFKKDGILIEVDGERPIDTIFEDILKRIEK
jgi:adenylate kinase